MRAGGGARFLEIRVALFCIGAVVWLAGILLGIDLLTGIAIPILLVALVLGLVARRMAERERRPVEERGPDL